MAQPCVTDRTARREVPCPERKGQSPYRFDREGKAGRSGVRETSDRVQKDRLFYSPAKRCRETAIGIKTGAEEIGVDTIVLEEDGDLSGTAYVLDECCLLMADRIGDDFIREWFSGRVDPSLIKSISSASEDMSDHLIERMTGDPTPGLLDINVSHDWNILALRENYLNLRYEESGWIGFLDGLAFYPHDGTISVAYGPISGPLLKR